MSLRRRITAATTVAVAAVAVLIAASGYLSTRSKLIGQVRHELSGRARAQIDFRQHAPPDSHLGRKLRARLSGPGGPAFGGAPGQFQIVEADGHIRQVGPYGPSGPGTAATPLPVNARIKQVAAGKAAPFYFAATVDHAHVELYVRNAGTAKLRDSAIEGALPLNSVDSELSGLSLTYGLIIAGGILLAVVIGLLVARSAVRPIVRFTDATEQVTASLDRPRRLEAGGAKELDRLALSFNQTLDALERSVTAQRHLIADASHELRTPLAALRSNIQIFLAAEALPADEREELQEAIVAEVDDLTQLVSDVLELARGVTPADQSEQVELDGAVRDAVERTQRRAPGLEFAVDLEPTVVLNNPDRVSRAVLNLVDNARKWSSADGLVEVRLHNGVLSVRDHGPGFRESDLEHVFERFYRADDARRMSGSGLGLAIVKQAAEASGGFAEADNAPGGGALLRVSFGP
ncbi:MAG: HAMP domain-containing histidine kinase, partial [Solirubrobacterales bacterium]|nr:HAMP domain-containing histidine kinase [Solirubrobacterales bacterium]